MNPRFVIFSSYGNDSVALIQWAHEEGLRDVVVVYSDTGWAAKKWGPRVERMEEWVRTLGYETARTSSIGFMALAHEKKAFPTQQFQWCSFRLKIEPAMRWLDERDPDKRAVCLVGVRREEGPDRANYPNFLCRSGSHGERVMIAPLADYTTEKRDELLARAGVDPLPHRSMECSPCVNSNRQDFRAMEEDDIAKAESGEKELNDVHGPTKNGKPRTLFRPHRHMGAVGVREVVKWAKSERGEYKPPADVAAEPELPLETEAVEGGCVSGWCGN